MQVKVTREFRAVPAGAVYPKEFHVDEIVDGRIADIALELKCGERIAVEAAQQQSGQQQTADTEETEDPDTEEMDDPDNQEGSAPDGGTPPEHEAKDGGPKTIIVRARLKDKYEGKDDKGKAIKIAKGGVVSAPLAQKLVDEGLAIILETKPA